MQRVVERNKQKQKAREKAKQEAIERKRAKELQTVTPNFPMPESVRITIDRAKKNQPESNIYFEPELEGEPEASPQRLQPPSPDEFHVEDLG